jgi:hypothetical protein
MKHSHGCSNGKENEREIFMLDLIIVLDMICGIWYVMCDMRYVMYV